MAPNVSLRNGERIKIGAYAHIGSHCSLWAGDSVGRITLGRHALLGPEVFITASNYETEPGTPVMDQPKRERDVVIGDDVWLGARVVVVPGVEIGDGCIVGASSVVTRSIPAGSIAVGNPARIVGRRGDPKAEVGGSGSRSPLGGLCRQEDISARQPALRSKILYSRRRSQ